MLGIGVLRDARVVAGALGGLVRLRLGTLRSLFLSVFGNLGGVVVRGRRRAGLVVGRTLSVVSYAAPDGTASPGRTSGSGIGARAGSGTMCFGRAASLASCAFFWPGGARRYAN